MKKEFQDRIDNYLLHRMTEEQRKAFEQELLTDEELRDQLEFTRAVQRTVRSRNEKLEAMERWRDDYVWGEANSHKPIANSQQSRANRTRQVLLWTSGIVAILVAGFFIFRTLHSDEVSVPNKPIILVRNGFRGGPDYSDIVRLLEEGNYEIALEAIDEQQIAVRADSCELVLKQYTDNEARAYDMQIVKDKYDDLKWLKIQALFGLHRLDEALTLLNDLRSSEGYYRYPADSLYNQLNQN